MLQTRIIPCLLLKNNGLVKTVKFKNETYIGDPINAVRIFNDKEADELIFLDIEASKKSKSPDLNLINSIASECFMPFSYGGGIRDLDTAKKLFKIGVEKLIFNTVTFENPKLIRYLSSLFGSQAIVASIDIKKNIFNKYSVYIRNGTYNTKIDPIKYALDMEKLGVGEIMINDIDNDGMMNGYNLELLKLLTSKVKVPLIACGGAGNLLDFHKAVKIASVSAVAAGSLFVYYGKTKGILINYPSRSEISKIFK